MTGITGPVDVAEEGYPVAVAGGGLVGMGLALALGRSGVAVALIEAAQVGDAGDAGGGDDAGFGARPIALSEGSRRILAALGAWPAIAAHATPIERIHVSDRGHFGFARLTASELGVDALGHVVAAADLERALRSALADLEAVHLLSPATVDGVDTARAGAARLRVRAAHGARDLAAHLVVVCDGGRSPLRQSLGVPIVERDYGQWAVSAHVEARCAHHGVAYERFTAAGPLALLPMQGRRCGLVWSVAAARAERLVSLDDTAFLEALGESFGGRLGGFVAAGPRSAFPLRLVRAARVVGERLAIVGNAANHLHPVAGQGLNLGLRDAEALAGSVAACLRRGGDPGEAPLLARYAEGRRRDQRRVRGATDALVRLFSNAAGPLVVARDVGLLAFDLLPPVKRRFARHAMGLGAPQGRLTRGLAL